MSRFTRLALALALLALPASALAQQPGRGLGMGPGAGMGPGMGQPHDPVATLLARKAELGLTDDQVKQLQALQKQLQEKNGPLIEKMQAERAAMLQQRQQHWQQMRPIADEIRENNRAAGDRIHQILTPEQQLKLHDLRRAQRGGRMGAPGVNRPMRMRRPLPPADTLPRP